MNDLDKRIAGLSAEKKKIFERLLTQRGLEGTISPPVIAPAPSGLPVLQPISEKSKARDFYNSLNENLNPTPFGQFSFFLNYGYVSDATPEYTPVALPEHYLNRNSVKLVLETIGQCPFNDALVLDISCGRGGTEYVIQSFFQPDLVAAMDLSSSAIRLSHSPQQSRNIGVLEGDAESLPFRSDYFHVVINIEASHLYPDALSFFREVFRVLQPEGHFLYADLQSSERIAGYVGYLQQIGFVIEQECDITNNVVLSCDQVARQRVQAYRNQHQYRVLEDFLATPGSRTYEDLKQRAWRYKIVNARKP